ncbi:hypothetical protein CCHOA_08760 [Corynebacterium choanae]|uniref:Uncharacterized protein n=1 Tax=Corynebacterium choanae TaxID=1862358 RepID=A0A3G6J8B1_9CORY|nr:hypothetical protein CCHOA_08760 [Corynebacterium choanae]
MIIRCCWLFFLLADDFLPRGYGTALRVWMGLRVWFCSAKSVVFDCVMVGLFALLNVWSCRETGHEIAGLVQTRVDISPLQVRGAPDFFESALQIDEGTAARQRHQNNGDTAHCL